MAHRDPRKRGERDARKGLPPREGNQKYLRVYATRKTKQVRTLQSFRLKRGFIKDSYGEVLRPMK